MLKCEKCGCDDERYFGIRNGKEYYIGQWKQGQMNGLAIFEWPDGKSYRGYYENDKKNGYGVESGKNKTKFEGRFKRGKQYGIGIITNEKGEKQYGLYLKGKKIKYLNEKDFKEEIENIEKEIQNINKTIEENSFFQDSLVMINKILLGYTTKE